jgi:hypothetical protein
MPISTIKESEKKFAICFVGCRRTGRVNIFSFGMIAGTRHLRFSQ